MKKRILFADDEVMVMDGLQRMLRSMRAEWEMEFVESAEAALRLLDQKPFDVIVSDMRMPRMNGAELLAGVMKRQGNGRGAGRSQRRPRPRRGLHFGTA
jgi:DNA-binding NtrC family response regulator